MSLRNPVIWSDGLFIKPHHFQQQQRYTDYVTRRRGDAVSAYQYGLETIEINRENLLHGRISIVSSIGVFPDRTPFEIPNECPSPEALDLSTTSIVNETVYLALPLWANGVPDNLTEDGGADQVARQTPLAQEVLDSTSSDAEPHTVNVGQLRPRLMLTREDRSSWTCIPIAQVQERRSDGGLILDPTFMPMACALEANPILQRALEDFTGLLHQRARQISTRLGALGQGGVAEVADFLLLQTVNRLGAQFEHLSSLNHVHPERLFEVFAMAAGELASFTHETRLPEEWPPYNHETPHQSFDPLIASLRRSLSVMLEPNAVALALQKHKFGLLTAPVADPALIQSSVFVLAVRAAMPIERLAKTFPSQVKVSSIEKIRELIYLHLPGVTLHAMPTAPRQLPYHAGYTYFLLDHNSTGWSHLQNASGFAFHVAGEFPDLEMQFWAIRGRRDKGLS